eukprot:m.163077 g.163077  ORF g.163077 m.163077 type:complete len:127 (+) comp24904_c0_seq17:1260-1640(+)
MTKMCSWATCGVRGLKNREGNNNSKPSTSKDHLEHASEQQSPYNDKDEPGDEDNDDEEEDHSCSAPQDAGIDLTPQEKEQIGRNCKRLIDAARRDFLASRGFHTNIVHYTTKNITLENALLLAWCP